MKQQDQIFKAIAQARPTSETTIACLYTGGRFPTACSPMPRVPAPAVGTPLEDLESRLTAALIENPAVHDGAIMVGRAHAAAPYRITGWSHRLFPPSAVADAAPNRGSAFHSCLAMSLEPDVDATYLVSGGRAYCFTNGAGREL